MKSTTIEGMFQLKNSKDKDIGVLRTNLPLKELEQEWTKFCNLPTSVDLKNINEFIEILQEKYKTKNFEKIMFECRVYPLY